MLSTKWGPKLSVGFHLYWVSGEKVWLLQGPWCPICQSWRRMQPAAHTDEEEDGEKSHDLTVVVFWNKTHNTLPVFRGLVSDSFLVFPMCVLGCFSTRNTGCRNDLACTYVVWCIDDMTSKWRTQRASCQVWLSFAARILWTFLPRRSKQENLRQPWRLGFSILFSCSFQQFVETAAQSMWTAILFTMWKHEA